MPYGSEEDKEYRLNEQQHMETILGNLYRLVEDNHVRVFGYLSEMMVRILSGNADVLSPDLSRNLLHVPENMHEAVNNAWKTLYEPTLVFCYTEPDGLNETQFKWVLLRIHEMVFRSIYNDVLSARSRQAKDRV